MSQQLPVSVIIPTYNRSAILKRSIEYLCQQDRAPLEILVIDQSESVPTEINDYLSQPAITGKVRWIRQQPPNAEKARNRGILEAKGDVLLFLDDDIECEPGLVAAHWKNYEDPQVAAVSGMILESSQAPTETLPQRFYAPKIGWMYFPLNYARRTECINLSTCNCSIRRQLSLAVGGFDENYIRTLFDDSDFSWRVHSYCKTRGLKVLHDPAAWLTHLQVKTGGRRPGKKNQFVVADSAAWQTWLYFFMHHWGLEAFKVLARRYRWWIWHRRNIARPWWLIVAHLYFALGLWKACLRLAAGQKLLDKGTEA